TDVHLPIRHRSCQLPHAGSRLVSPLKDQPLHKIGSADLPSPLHKAALLRQGRGSFIEELFELLFLLCYTNHHVPPCVHQTLVFEQFHDLTRSSPSSTSLTSCLWVVEL